MLFKIVSNLISCLSGWVPEKARSTRLHTTVPANELKLVQPFKTLSMLSNRKTGDKRYLFGLSCWFPALSIVPGYCFVFWHTICIFNRKETHDSFIETIKNILDRINDWNLRRLKTESLIFTVGIEIQYIDVSHDEF